MKFLPAVFTVRTPYLAVGGQHLSSLVLVLRISLFLVRWFIRLLPKRFFFFFQLSEEENIRSFPFFFLLLLFFYAYISRITYFLIFLLETLAYIKMLNAWLTCSKMHFALIARVWKSMSIGCN